MIGAIVGDIVGSIYEFNNVKTPEFPLFSVHSTFTDDSLMTLAVAAALTETERKADLEKNVIKKMQEIGREYPYPMGGYGGRFGTWLRENDPKPYNSYGNGAAMRVSPVAYFARDVEECKELSRIVTGVTHNHPEGLKGAECVAVLTFLALCGEGKEKLYEVATEYYPELKTLKYDDIWGSYYFDESCQGTVPQAIVCFNESHGFEEAIRRTMMIGGDSDTLGAIVGAIAGAYYGVQKEIMETARKKLDNKLREILDRAMHMSTDYGVALHSLK